MSGKYIIMRKEQIFITNKPVSCFLLTFAENNKISLYAHLHYLCIVQVTYAIHAMKTLIGTQTYQNTKTVKYDRLSYSKN